MSVQLTFPFTTPSNYTYDTDKLEITAGILALALQQDDVDFTEDFADDTDFTYDSSKAEFSGGQVQQKDARPSNSTFYATYTSNIDGSWGNGTLTGTPIGGASVSGGELDLAHNDNRYVDYDANGNADSQQTGCIRFLVTPNYATWPPTGMAFFVIGKQNGSLWNLIQLQHKSSGQLSLALYNQTGIVIYDSDLGVWSPTMGNKYEIELNWDFTTGATRLFIDGVQHGSTITDTGIRSSDINLFRIGSSYNAGYNSNFSIDNVLVFSTVQHTTDYTPDWSDIYETIYVENNVVLPEMEHTGTGTIKLFNSLSLTYTGSPKILLEIGRSGNKLYWNGSAWAVSDETYAQSTDPTTFNTNCGSLDVDGEDYGQFTIVFPDSNTQSTVDELTANMNVDIGYLTTNPTVEPNASFRTDELESIVETSTITGSDQIKYIIKIGDSWYWLNSGTLEESDETYSQANTVTELNTYIDDIISASSEVKIKIFLHSDDGTTTPQLDTVVINYSYGGEDQDTIETCIVWGYISDCEDVVDTTQIKVRLNKEQSQYKNYTTVRRKEISITPDASKYWEVELIENENMEIGLGYIFDFNNGKTEKKVVPNQSQIDYYSLEDL